MVASATAEQEVHLIYMTIPTNINVKVSLFIDLFLTLYDLIHHHQPIAVHCWT